VNESRATVKTKKDYTIHYSDEKDDNIKTGGEESTHYENEKEDDPKSDEDQGDTIHYKDEKDNDKKTDEHEVNANDHHEDTKDEDEGYTNHDDEDETSVFRDADSGFEIKCDAEEVVVVISVCSDDPVSFRARHFDVAYPPPRWLAEQCRH
jgi:hypothetical protein